MKEVNWTSIKDNSVKVLRGSWSVASIALAIGLGWYGKGIYDKTQVTPIAASVSKHLTRTIDKTSVAVNERDELIIFDRESGDYTVYDKNVRLAIFNQQFNKIQTNFKNKK
jgi:uncharacterized membrane protein YhiD involved in acid resistance